MRSQRPGPARARGLVVAAVIGLLVGLDPAGVASSAHTELLQASPGPSQRVGGTVDFIDLVFLAPVSDVEVDVVGPDGQPVPTMVESPEGQIIHVAMEAVELPGSYRVTYRMRSDDGDLTESGFLFTYQPGALQPVRFDAADVPDDGSGLSGSRLAGLIAVGALLVLCLVLARRLLRRRAELARMAGAGGRPPGS